MDFMQIDRRKLEEEYNFMKKLLAKDTWMLSQTLVSYMKKEYWMKVGMSM